MRVCDRRRNVLGGHVCELAGKAALHLIDQCLLIDFTHADSLRFTFGVVKSVAAAQPPGRGRVVDVLIAHDRAVNTSHLDRVPRWLLATVEERRPPAREGPGVSWPGAFTRTAPVGSRGTARTAAENDCVAAWPRRAAPARNAVAGRDPDTRRDRDDGARPRDRADCAGHLAMPRPTSGPARALRVLTDERLRPSRSGRRAVVSDSPAGPPDRPGQPLAALSSHGVAAADRCAGRD
jgi:hypothetical protein